MSQQKEDRTQLRDETEARYGTIFYIVFTVAVLYLAVIMWRTFS
jgi:hypothetical protein